VSHDALKERSASMGEEVKGLAANSSIRDSENGFVRQCDFKKELAYLVHLTETSLGKQALAYLL
jgi:hypothetical protein